jgi:hypothetical protein
MRRGLLSATISGLIAAACSSGSSTPDTAKICTPGAYVFCLCADGSHGTKLCHDDGQAFDACSECQNDFGTPGAGGAGAFSGSSGFGPGGSAAGGVGGTSGGGGASGKAGAPGGSAGAAGVGGSSGSTAGGGAGGKGGATGGTAGTSGASGKGGTSGNAGVAGASGKGGSGVGGAAGTSGTGGAAGQSGSAGAGGNKAGAGGAAGSGGTVAGDGCPGIAASVTPDMDTLLPGSTVGASSHFPMGCASSAGADVVYAITPSATGTLTVTVQAQAPLSPALFAWTGACGAAPTSCADGTGSAGTATLDVAVKAGTPAWVAVHSDGTSGAFALALHLAPAAVCGNAKVEAPEQCDDGPANGASAACTTSCATGANPSNADCPGLPVHVWGPTTTVSGSTASYMNFDQGTCGGASAKDRFYQVVPHVAGTLHATLTTASFDAVLYARTGDCITGTEVACNDTIGKGGDTIDVAVGAGAPVWVAVDGYSTQSGTFTLSLSVQ